MFTEPLAGWRHVTVNERRTRVDWAHQIRELLDVHYADTPKIRLVMDNLNTHSIASLYEAFSPNIARRLAKRLEIHYTPKHGSWLNIAEDRIKCLDPAVFRPQDCYHRSFTTRSLCVGSCPKQESKRRRLAIYHRFSTN